MNAENKRAGEKKQKLSLNEKLTAIWSKSLLQ